MDARPEDETNWYAIDGEQPIDRDCEHTDLVRLGSDGLNDYFRCELCTSVVVRAGRRTAEEISRERERQEREAEREDGIPGLMTERANAPASNTSGERATNGDATIGDKLRTIWRTLGR